MDLSRRIKLGKKEIQLLDVLMAFGLLAAGLLVRICLAGYRSGDWEVFLEPWTNQLKQHGFRALATGFYNYTPIYMYILWFLTLLPVDTLLGIKAVSVIFDFILAVTVAKIVTEIKPGANPLLPFGIVWLAPAVISNSSMWGQCDAVYASFLMLTVLFFVKDQSRVAMIFYGIAFAFKLQAFFWLPVIILLWLFKKIKTIDFLWIPLMYFISIVPAWMAGRPFSELLGIYFAQVGVDTNRLSMKYPNIYYIIGELNLPEWYTHAGKYFAVGVILLFMVALIYKLMKTRLTPELLLLICYSQGALALYFLPQMHERYGYFIEIIAIILGVLCIKMFWVPVVHILITFITYSYYYNYDRPKNIPIFVLALCMLALMLFMIYKTVVYREKGESADYETAGEI